MALARQESDAISFTVFAWDEWEGSRGMFRGKEDKDVKRETRKAYCWGKGVQ